MKQNPLSKLGEFGQSVWIDFIRRGMLDSGWLRQEIEDDGVSGVTSNPAIFEKAIAGSHDYDEAIQNEVRAGKSPAEIYETLVIEDIQRTADTLRPVYNRLQGRDGFVSLEVSPHLAYNTEGTIAEARRLWKAVDRPNLLIKVPATLEGLPAIQDLIAEGINVNVTLLFGLPRYRRVAEAYIAGLETRANRGESVEQVASVASFFLSRIDTLVDVLLESVMNRTRGKASSAAALRGKAAIASGKLAYQIYKEVFSGERFRRLAEQGARPQRLLWASTSTKNPAYQDTKYVEPLIGPNTINTMPQETLAAYRDHGAPAVRLENELDEARSVMHRLPGLGVDMDGVTRQLEEEGIHKFVQPFDQLLHTLATAAEGQAVER